MAPKAKKKPTAKTPPGKKPGRRRALKWSALGLLWVAFGLVLLLAYWAYELPDVDTALAEARPPVVTILDRHRLQLATLGGRGGAWVARDAMPPALVQAVLAIEDRRFYDHNGVDVWGVLRAIVTNIREGEMVQGGSTITQQLAKNLFLKPDRTLKRKVQEAMLAYGLEDRLSKDDILEQYLNRVYLGSGAYGVEAAARRYFGKPVDDISLAQAALLAGLLKAPSSWSPLNNRDAANGRTGVVLDAMVEAGYLTPEDRDRAGLPLIAPRPAGDSAGYFADWIAAHLPDVVGEITQDMTVRTTFDPVVQAAGQRALAHALDGVPADWKVSQGAIVAMSPDGAVRAMVGGRDYRRSDYNRAVVAERQPGSAFKLFVYLAALEAGLTPESRMRDSPVILEGWAPKNYSGAYQGSMDLRTAFAKSVNTVAVKVAERADRTNVIDAAGRLGITTPIVKQPSTALGTTEVRLLDLTAAYAVIAHEGLAATPYGIAQVTAQDGATLYNHEADQRRMISAIHAAQMRSMLRSVVTNGTGRAAGLSNGFVAGKTGTSQGSRDAWFIGFTDTPPREPLVAGVWVGNDDASPMTRITGGGLPARIWKDFMSRTGR